GSLFALGSTDSIREGLAAWLGLPTAGRLLIVRPVLALSRSMARLDDQVIDAGVRGSVAVAGAVSQLLERWAERGFDASVWTLARVTASGAKSSMAFDDLGFDGFVEGVGRVTGAAGARCRRWQTGLSHHYYAVAGAGLLVLLGAILIWS
ncbi:MAG: hypothetical protein KJO65_06055, partial [Gemmatimonadetes bacterium]|nr:hypothetical protein [Gemmatimonadota bacterium]